MIWLLLFFIFFVLVMSCSPAEAATTVATLTANDGWFSFYAIMIGVIWFLIYILVGPVVHAWIDTKNKYKEDSSKLKELFLVFILAACFANILLLGDGAW